MIKHAPPRLPLLPPVQDRQRLARQPPYRRFSVQNAICVFLLVSLGLEAQNLLENPGFESGQSGWYPFGPARLEVSSNLRKSGALAVRVTNRTSTWNGVAQDVYWSFLFGSGRYAISAWVYVESDSPQSVQLTMKRTNASGDSYQGIATARVAGRTWTRLAGEYEHTDTWPSTLDAMEFYVEGPSVGVNLIVDDLFIGNIDWRDDINQKIESVRKSTVSIQLVDRADRPVANAPLQIRQVRSGFGFGAALSAGRLSDQPYADFVGDNFEWVEMRTELSWAVNEPRRGTLLFDEAEKVAAWCSERSIRIRGQSILRDSDQDIPSWLYPLSGPQVNAAFEDRVSTLLTTWRDRIDHWDVLSDFLTGFALESWLGPEAPEWAIDHAQQEHPAGHYFLRESLPLVGPAAQDIGALDSLLAYLERMQNMNPRPDGLAYEVSLNGDDYRDSIGGWTPFKPDDLGPGYLDLLTAHGAKVWLVNAAVQDSDPEEAADLLERVMRTAYSRSAFLGMILRGVAKADESGDWTGALIHADNTLTPSGERFLALRREWTTQVDLRTDAAGTASFKGHQGEYEVQVINEGITTTSSFVNSGADPSPSWTIRLGGDSASPATLSVRAVSPGTLTIEIHAEAGTRWEMESSPDLLNWTAVAGFEAVIPEQGSIRLELPRSQSLAEFLRATWAGSL